MGFLLNFLVPQSLQYLKKEITSVVMENSFVTDPLSRDVRKPDFGISDQIRHKPAYTPTEES